MVNCVALARYIVTEVIFEVFKSCESDHSWNKILQRYWRRHFTFVNKMVMFTISNEFSVSGPGCHFREIGHIRIKINSTEFNV